MSIDLRLGSFSEVIAEQANLILTSPPYNIGSQSPARITNRKSGGYDAKSYRGIREYPDNLPEVEYQRLQIEFLRWASKHLKTNGVIVYNHKPRRKKGKMIHPIEWIRKVSQLDLMEEIVWDRGSTHNHSRKLMWPHTERLYVLKNRGDRYILENTNSLNYRSDVWRIGKPRINGHNAPFPLELARNIILAWSSPGDMVVDPYAGSGTTAIACHHTGRNFIGAELIRDYRELALRRISDEC